MPTPVQFNLKHFETVVASMLNYLAGVQSVITDYNIGSVNRTLLESVAMEIEELYYRLFSAIEAAIPESTYLAFGFTKAAATLATGAVTFSRSTAADVSYLIPAGIIVQTADGVQVKTVAAVTMQVGQSSVNASIVAVKSGSSGNVAASSITVLSNPVTGIEAVTNAVNTAGGTDEEPDDAMAARFATFVAALARSPINGIVAGALTAMLVDTITGGITEQVTGAKLVEPYHTDPAKPVGVANLYIENGSGTASGSLVAKCQTIIDGYVDAAGKTVIGYKAAGVIVTVIAASAVSVNLVMTVTLETGAVLAEVHVALSAAAKGVLDALKIGGTLDWGALYVALRQTSGVKTLTLTTPSASVTALVSQRLVPGTITVTG